MNMKSKISIWLYDINQLGTLLLYDIASEGIRFCSALVTGPPTAYNTVAFDFWTSATRYNIDPAMGYNNSGLYFECTHYGDKIVIYVLFG